MQLKHALMHNIIWKVASFIFLFVTNILIVRILGAAESGSLFYFIAWLTLLITILKFGLDNGLTFLATKNPTAISGLVKFLIPLSVLQTLIAATIIFFSTRKGLIFHMHASIIFVMANIGMYYVFAFYASKKMFGSYNIINLIFTAISTLIFIYWYYFRPKTSIQLTDFVFRVLTWAAAANVVALALNYWFVAKHTTTPPKLDKLITTKLFRYSGLNFFSHIIMFMIVRADYYFVENYCDPTVFGNYVQAAKFGQMMMMIPGLMGGVIFPYSIRRQQDMQHKVMHLCKVVTLCFIGGYTVVLLIGGWLFPWMLGAQFGYVHHMLVLLLPGVLFASINLLLISYFEGQNRQKLIFVSNLVIIVLLIVMDRLAVPSFGYKAAAIAFTIANLTGTGILSYFFLQKSGIHWSNIVRLQSVFREKL